jgi:hypothetical protein
MKPKTAILAELDANGKPQIFEIRGWLGIAVLQQGKLLDCLYRTVYRLLRVCLLNMFPLFTDLVHNFTCFY